MPPPRTEPERPARDAALQLLARREHSTLELRHKLLRRDYPAERIDPVLEALQSEGWLNDRRFAEVYAVSRMDKGYGPLRIRRELRERGVPDAISESVLAPLEADWAAMLDRLYRKRFRGRPLRDAAERLRRMRFLRQRGFTMAQIEHQMGRSPSIDENDAY